MKKSDIQILNEQEKVQYYQKKLKEVEKNLEEAVSLLKTLRIDAMLALDGEWDRGDDGFELQISNIKNFLNKLKKT